MELERRDAGQGAGGGPDLGREVGERRQVVAEGRGLRGEPIAGQLHAVAGVAGEADDNAVEALDLFLHDVCCLPRARPAEGHAIDHLTKTRPGQRRAACDPHPVSWPCRRSAAVGRPPRPDQTGWPKPGVGPSGRPAGRTGRPPPLARAARMACQRIQAIAIPVNRIPSRISGAGAGEGADDDQRDAEAEQRAGRPPPGLVDPRTSAQALSEALVVGLQGFFDALQLLLLAIAQHGLCASLPLSTRNPYPRAYSHNLWINFLPQPPYVVRHTPACGSPASF